MRKSDAQLLASFKEALENGRLRMVYQPKVSLRDGSLKRVEALVRWDDPELGSIEPSRFVPLAEEHGLIDGLTQWGLRTILRQWLDWRGEGIDICIAFNISALSLQQLDFPDLVERMCRALDVPTDRLVLELQRSLDHFDRQFSYITLSRLLLAPLPADLGVQVGPVLAAAEPATRGSDSAAFGYAPLSAARASGPAQEDLRVEPGQMEVTAALDVTFALDQGASDQHV